MTYLYNMIDIDPVKVLYLLIVASILLIVSNILIFYLIKCQLQMAEEKNEHIMIIHNLENKSKYYEELSKRQRITNKAMHDLKNQLFALRYELKENQNKGTAMLDELYERINASYTLKFTGIEAVDALITSKLVTMKENNIEFCNSIFISDKNRITVTDLCVLIGNLLDNAIEANMELDLDNKYISLKISQQRNYLSMCVSNSKNADCIEIDINNVVTTKKQKEMHSFGLRSVKEIVKKYDGNVTLRQEKNKFEVIILMKNILG